MQVTNSFAFSVVNAFLRGADVPEWIRRNADDEYRAEVDAIQQIWNVVFQLDWADVMLLEIQR